MGYFYAGLPPYMLTWAARTLPAGCGAVETGTYLGDSAAQIAEAMGSCATIEKSEQLARAAQARFKDDPRVRVLQGSSRDLLPQLVEEADGPKLWWLDAHWSGGVGAKETSGADDPCPVLGEIEAITSSRTEPGVILVDDARIFGCASPGDVYNRSWPSMSQVLAALEAAGLQTLVLDDVIVGVPPHLRDEFALLQAESRQGLVGSLAAQWPGIDRRHRSRLRSVARRARAIAAERTPAVRR
jgi:hypothetical protein